MTDRRPTLYFVLLILLVIVGGGIIGKQHQRITALEKTVREMHADLVILKTDQLLLSSQLREYESAPPMPQPVFLLNPPARPTPGPFDNRFSR